RMSYQTKLYLSVAYISLLSFAAAQAETFDVPGGDLEAALNAFAAQSKVQLMVSTAALKGVRTRGTRGNFSPDVALSRILTGTGFVSVRDPNGAISIFRGERHSDNETQALEFAQ